MTDNTHHCPICAEPFMADTPAQVALDEKGVSAALEAANELTCGGGAPVRDYVSGIIRAYLSSLCEAGDDGQGALVERYADATKRNAAELATMPIEVIRQNYREFASEYHAHLTRENAALRADKERLERERGRYRGGLQVLATTFYKGDEHQDYAKHVLGNDAAERRLAEQEFALTHDEATLTEGEPSEAGKWAIDNSTDSPILTYEKCSVIQDEQAHYVMSLIRRDIGEPSEAEVRQAGDILMQHGLNAPEQVIYGAARALLASKSKGGQADG